MKKDSLKKPRDLRPARALRPLRVEKRHKTAKERKKDRAPERAAASKVSAAWACGWRAPAEHGFSVAYPVGEREKESATAGARIE
jgi:hypothetical protein